MLAVINPELDRLARARYVSITTYRADGTPAAAPAWCVSEGGYLQVIAKSSMGTVKRLRSNENIAIAPCDSRGGLQGDPVDATAAVIEDPELVSRVEQLLRQRYGLVARVLGWLNRLRGNEPNVALAITVPPGN